MKILILPLLLLLIIQNLRGQTAWPDTLSTTVDLTKFKLDKKVVKAEYGKVIMYFNQTDYLGEKTDADTVRITPKYFDEHSISNLLKKGKVRVLRRSTNSFEDRIIHKLEQFGSMDERLFEFTDSIVFFNVVESRRMINFFEDELSDSTGSTVVQNKDPIVQVRKFEYEEEFADTKDTTRIKIKDYFPTHSSMYYVYNNPDNDYGETDTNQCRLAIIQGRDVFYFADCYDKFGVVSIGTQMFGSGIYFYRNDSLFTIEADYEKDIPEKGMEEAMLLLPPTMAPGDSSIIVDSIWNHRQVFTYLSNEDLTIKDTIYKDCIKIKILDYWDSTIYLGYIWLKKRTGLIKWMRGTGRVDELINCFDHPWP